MKLGPKYKICRRLGSDVFEKCGTQKFIVSQARKEKSSRDKRRGPISSFGAQLLEKQKVRLSYGVNERQFSNYVNEASATHDKNPGQKIFELLETRLDNVVYRMGLTKTRRAARQMVSHGHILVNGKKQKVPSRRMHVGDKISIRDGSAKSILFADLEKKIKNHDIPNWLTFNPTNLTGEMKDTPSLSDKSGISFNTILEFYSR